MIMSWDAAAMNIDVISAIRGSMRGASICREVIREAKERSVTLVMAAGGGYYKPLDQSFRSSKIFHIEYKIY
jgi:hypothetical protein